MLGLLLVAVSVGMSNFAASVGLGASGTDRRTRLHIAIIFGIFEGGMPALGLLLGRTLAGTLGSAAHWAGAGLLIATGGYGVVRAIRGRHEPAPAQARAGQPVGRLLVTGLALSIDNLVVGFAVGAFPVSLVTAVITIAAVSVAMSLVGLELGSRLGARLNSQTESRGEILGGLVLIGVGIALAAGIP
ncbi:MAG: manganese efflux pump MntP family protein [Streptosporangiaceae bacterium]